MNINLDQILLAENFFPIKSIEYKKGMKISEFRKIFPEENVAKMVSKNEFYGIIIGKPLVEFEGKNFCCMSSDTFKLNHITQMAVAYHWSKFEPSKKDTPVIIGAYRKGKNEFSIGGEHLGDVMKPIIPSFLFIPECILNSYFPSNQ